MEKTYKNLTGFALSTILCLGMAFSASAQRGGEHSDNGSRSGGGSTPPPAAPQPQVQRSSPPPQQQSAPAPQQQRPAPQQQAQPQFQRGSQQTQSTQPSQSGSFDRARTNNATGSTQNYDPRGSEHRPQPVFTPANPNNNNNGRRYPGITQRGNSNSYNPRGGTYNRPGAAVLITAVVTAIAAIPAYNLATTI
ncbi:hypothetical protein HK413_13180 [Mucilaginibacter sp. S1162]|uniref:Translation initiation factor IF-2 n=1 Tax=Mucilaginibacter humi TaxID=2732510 RepID=A0ABX1W7A2_9SPHI|nr:hypothetical protein [Mucilaginibacter humi]NNU34771.1 hypothetical protein [Mucilaginibacter humi]